MERMMKLVRGVCRSSFTMCASIFCKETPKQTTVPPHEVDEYEIIRDQSKAEQKTAPDEKWVADFESWTKKEDSKKNDHKEVDSNKGAVPQAPSGNDIKRNLAGVDEDTIIKKKNIIDDKAADMFVEMDMAPSIKQKPSATEAKAETAKEESAAPGPEQS